MEHKPLTDQEERVAKAIVDAAFAVHSTLGPGLLESIYELCLCHELAKRGLSFRRQVEVPVVYDGITFQAALRLDVLVEELVICELKAAETDNPVFSAQILTQLKLTGKRLGLLIDLNVPRIKDGIRRIIC